MPLLAALLGNAFSIVLAWLTTVLTRKLAIGAALGAFLIAGWIALQVALESLWTAVGYVIPDVMVEPLGMVAYMLPSNLSLCIEALLLAKIGRWLWDRQREWALAMAAV